MKRKFSHKKALTFSPKLYRIETVDKRINECAQYIRTLVNQRDNDPGLQFFF